MESTSSSSKRSTKPEGHESEESSSNLDGNSAKEPVNGKRLKKDDSGINIIPESDNSDGSDSSDNSIVCVLSSKLCDQANEISTGPDESEKDSNDSGNLESISMTESEAAAAEENSAIAKPFESFPCLQDAIRKKASRDPPGIISSSDSEDDIDIEKVKPKNKEIKNFDPTPNAPRPKHNWSAPKSILSRQYGYSSKYSPDLFRYNCYGALHMVERLELMYKMKKHDGCVNALNFNTTGTRLVSGSDDLHVIVWNWTISEPVLEYRSGHQANVFQAKFMPLSNDCFIVTCARDGAVRLGELSSEGVCKGTRKLAQHKGSAHKLALQMDSPHYFLTCGEDAAVFGIDLRQEKHNKLLVCKSKEKKVPLYTIFINPQKSYEFAVGGRSQYVKVYDTRYPLDTAYKDFCPEHLVNDNKVNVTSLVYNYTGTEILASYNDEDIYLFDAAATDTTEYIHRYRGHRNNQTVKGTNFFGSKSEYIMSGSDCGCIFFWEKQSEHIVKYMYGDEGGAVNCLEQHPTMPVLATSGLDDDIKIWVPSCEDPPDLSNLKTHISRNMQEREEDHSREYPDAFVDQTIWFLMQHLSRSRRRQIEGSSERDDSDSSTSSDDDMEVSGVSAPQCNQS
ncbi:DDB1- and CUL4-associated factor 8-like [Argiope bruennichi]|uniref:DDB1- and CUL4-associated factor 8 like protein n=1 Tax=Argiope bruennichi TaxID=94029 RepID=A0A8T0G3X2_ARGBR|nr:DDB1- and CUL4-associated factor 8-like [Argiope bruennichi]XP_055947460.1 DDB1- and CUL4-associated factor 8-like [Argiope bruennichi]KAF8796559.1 DDB1- and CUL4-associated factor 8 like protein [Argiope bruennichi]